MRGLQMGGWAALLAITPAQSSARIEPLQEKKAGVEQQAERLAQPANASRALVSDFDIACKYRSQTYMLHGKTILPVSAPGQSGRFFTSYQAEPANDLDYLFPTGICADLCAYFNPFMVRPPEGKAASRLKELPGETVGGVPCRVFEILNPEMPPEQPFGRGVPVLPSVRLRWYLSGYGQVRRIAGEFHLLKSDGKTLDPNLLVMDATFTLRGPKGSVARPVSAPPLRTFDVGTDDKSAVLTILDAPGAPLLAVAPSTGGVTLWNSDTQRLAGSLAGSTGWPPGLAGSRDGRRAAVPGDKDIPVWDTASGKQVQTLGADLKGFRGLAFSPDGHLLAAGIAHANNQAGIAVWNVETGKRVADFNNVFGEQLAFSPDGKILAALSNSEIHLWDTSTWQTKTIAAVTGESMVSVGGSLAFSPDSRLLAIGGQCGMGMSVDLLSPGQNLNPDAATGVQIWDARTGRRLQTLRGTTGPVLSLAFSPDGKTLAVVDQDISPEGQGPNSAVLLWDTQTWRPIGITAVEHGKPVDRVAWTSDGAALVTSYRDRTVKLWPRRADLRKENPVLKSLRTSTFIAFGLFGFVAASTPALADARSEALLRQVKVVAHSMEPLVGEYEVRGTGKLALWQGKYSQQVVAGGWGWEGGQLSQETFNLFDPLVPASVSTRYLGRQSIGGETYDVVEQTQVGYIVQICIGSDGLIHRARIAPVPTKPKIPAPVPTSPRAAKPTAAVRPAFPVDPPKVASTEAAELVVTSYHKARSFLPRLAFPPPAHTFQFPNASAPKKQYPFRMGLSPDGALIAVIFTDKTAQIVDAAQGKPVCALEEPPSDGILVFSPDSKRLAVSNGSGGFRMYDTSTGRKLFDLAGGKGWIEPVFSPDGKMLAGVDRDNAILLWNVATGQSLPALPQKGVQKAQFSPDDKILYSAHQEGASWFLTTWNIAARSPLHKTPFAGNWQYAAALSPDGKWLVLSCDPGAASVFNAQTGAKVRDLTETRSDTHLLQFADDSKTLFAADSDRHGDTPTLRTGLVAWDTALWNAQFAGILPDDVFLDVISTLKIAPDGKSFAHCELSRGIRVWNMPHAALPAQNAQAEGALMEAETALPASVAISDIECRYKNQTYRLHGRTISQSESLPLENRFMTLYRMAPANDLDYRFPSGLCADLCAYFNPFAVRPPEGNNAARLQVLPSEAVGGVVCRVMELFNPELPPAPSYGRKVPLLPRVRLRWYVSPQGRIRRMVGEFQLFLPDGKTPDPDLLVMDAALTVREAQGSPPRVSSGPLLRSLDVVAADNAAILALAASPNAPLLATADNFGAVTVWNTDTAKPLATLNASPSWQQALALSANGARLAGASGDGSLRAWDVASGKATQLHDAPAWSGSGLALSPEGTLLAASTRQPRGVYVWNAATGALVSKLEKIDGEQIVFSPDGKMLAVRSDNTVRLWNTATWEQEATLTLAGFASVGIWGGNSLAFSPDSRLLAVGDKHQDAHIVGFINSAQPPQPQSEMSVQIWDVQTRQRIQTLQGATGPVLALAFSPDGKTLAVVDRDWSLEGPGRNAAVLLWDTQTWQQVSTLGVDHGKTIENLAWTSDSATVITSYRDLTLKFWAVPKRNFSR